MLLGKRLCLEVSSYSSDPGWDAEREGGHCASSEAAARTWEEVDGVSRRTPAHLKMGVIYRSSPLFFFGIVLTFLSKKNQTKTHPIFNICPPYPQSLAAA